MFFVTKRKTREIQIEKEKSFKNIFEEMRNIF